MTEECVFCHALLFLNEATNNGRPWRAALSGARIRLYSLCCARGTIDLPHMTMPPQPLASLLDGTHQHSSHFRQNARAFNNALAMASSAAHVDRSIVGGAHQFKISGGIHHLMGPLHSLGYGYSFT